MVLTYHIFSPNSSRKFLFCYIFQVKAKPGAGSCPLQMVAYWKCSDTYTDLRLDYKYNPHAMASTCPLLNLSIAVPVDGGVVNVQSQPNGTWYVNKFLDYYLFVLIFSKKTFLMKLKQMPLY